MMHIAVFSLKHTENSAEETKFLEDIFVLSKIEGVKDFRVWRQTSEDTPYRFGISMRFENKDAFDSYMADLSHKEFADTRWFPEITGSYDINFETIGEPGHSR